MDPLTTALGAIIVALISAGGGAAGAWARMRVDHSKADHDRIGHLENRLDGLEVRLNAREDYIGTLRQHIYDGKPPPPPPFPWVPGPTPPFVP